MEKETQQKRAISQDEILLVALKLFGNQGYFNTSLTDIKDELGLKTTSGIYQHFKTKQAIAEKLYENILDSLSISVDDIRRRNSNASEQLREIVDLFFTLTDDAPEVMRFLLLTKLEEFLPEKKPLFYSTPFYKIRRIFQNGIKQGEIRAIDPAIAYSHFFGIVNHALQMVLTGALNKKAGSYQSQVWLAAWNCVAKR